MHERFKGSYWYPIKERVIVVGAGGIGTHFVFQAVRAGIKVMVYDDDTVDDVNISGQLFRLNHVGERKVIALNSLCSELCHSSWEYLSYKGAKYTRSSMAARTMVVCADNREARVTAFERWKTTRDRKLFVDGRLFGEFFKIVCIPKGELEDKYLDTLFKGEEDEHASCTTSQNTHMAAKCAATMMKFITSFEVNSKLGEVLIPIPFTYSESDINFEPEILYP